MREAIQEITQLQEKAKEHRDEIKRLQQENRRLLVQVAWHYGTEHGERYIRAMGFTVAEFERFLRWRNDVVTRGRALVEEAGRG